MQSGHAVEPIAPVLAAGVGARQGSGWTIRSVSFWLSQSNPGGPALGIVAAQQAAAAALIDLLSGQIPPAYGNLRVLGQDMSTTLGRAAVRRQIGVARRNPRPRPVLRIRGLVAHAARLARQPGSDRHLLVAAILDRLALTPWADVPLRSAPELVARKARLAAATVHQPSLLLIDGLLDQLSPADGAALADVIRELERDTAVIAIGRDAHVLTLACHEVLALSDGILIGSRPLDLPQPQALPLTQPACRD